MFRRISPLELLIHAPSVLTVPPGAPETYGRVVRRSRRSVFVFIAAALGVSGMVSVPAAAGSPAGRAGPGSDAAYAAGRYIVTFADDPVASYEGYEAGFPATRPHPSGKVDPASPAVVNWQRHLTNKHDQALGAVGATK